MNEEDQRVHDHYADMAQGIDSNDHDEEEFEKDDGCPYCHIMWFELTSEGAPCGIDNCMIFTCCDQAWKDHIAKCHPNYGEEESKEPEQLDL